MIIDDDDIIKESKEELWLIAQVIKDSQVKVDSIKVSTANLEHTITLSASSLKSLEKKGTTIYFYLK